MTTILDYNSRKFLVNVIDGFDQCYFPKGINSSALLFDNQKGIDYIRSFTEDLQYAQFIECCNISNWIETTGILYPGQRSLETNNAIESSARHFLEKLKQKPHEKLPLIGDKFLWTKQLLSHVFTRTFKRATEKTKHTFIELSKNIKQYPEDIRFHLQSNVKQGWLKFAQTIHSLATNGLILGVGKVFLAFFLILTYFKLKAIMCLSITVLNSLITPFIGTYAPVIVLNFVNQVTRKICYLWANQFVSFVAVKVIQRIFRNTRFVRFTNYLDSVALLPTGLWLVFCIALPYQFLISTRQNLSISQSLLNYTNRQQAAYFEFWGIKSLERWNHLVTANLK